MTSSFDPIATIYDQHFTHSPLGTLQRKNVWKYLESKLSQSPQRILELNCGTGEDSRFLASLGHQVLATDVSTRMLEVSRSKMGSDLENQVSFELLDLSSPMLHNQELFDVLFSNFGGINCLPIEKVSQLAEFIYQNVKSGGDCILVIMPQHTYVARWYHRIKGTSEEYNQRSAIEGLEVSIGDQSVLTYYYPVKMIRKCFEKFMVVKVRSIGFIPSYFNQSRWIAFWSFIERWLGQIPWFPNQSDHYLIHLRKP